MAKAKAKEAEIESKENVVEEDAATPYRNPYQKDLDTEVEDPRQTAEDTQQEATPQNAGFINKTETQPNHDYKKRYDDLKKHYDQSLNNFRQRETELLQKVTANQPEYKAPKTAEELEQFKSQYPDVYEVVESVAHMQSENQVAVLQERLDAMQGRETELLKREAEKDLVAKHPDFEELRSSDEFHNWAEDQPEEIKDWIYNNPNNASLASKAIDLFKLETGFSAESSETKMPTSQSKAQDAAELVSTKTTSVDTNEPKIWTQEEIAALPMDEYDRLEAEIDQAVREGRVRD